MKASVVTGPGKAEVLDADNPQAGPRAYATWPRTRG